MKNNIKITADLSRLKQIKADICLHPLKSAAIRCKKNFKFLILTVAILFSLQSGVALAEETSTGSTPTGDFPLLAFHDLKSDHWAYESVESLKSIGAISGYSDGTFRPNANITRAEFMKIAVMASLYYQNDNIESSDAVKNFVQEELIKNAERLKKYGDLSRSHWAHDSIQFLQLQGFVSGYGDKTVGVNKAITRAEAIKIIIKLMKINEKYVVNEQIPFYDVKPTDWHRTFLLIAKYIGITKGYEDQTYRPNKAITRAEATKLLSEFKNVQVDGQIIRYNGKDLDFSPLLKNVAIESIKIDMTKVDHGESDSQLLLSDESYYRLISDDEHENEVWYYFTSLKKNEWINVKIFVEDHKQVFIGFQSEDFPQGSYTGQYKSGLKINDQMVIHAENFSEASLNEFTAKKVWSELTINQETNVKRYYTQAEKPTNAVSVHEFYMHPKVELQSNKLYMKVPSFTHPGENIISLKFEEGEECGVVIIVKQ